MNAIGKRPVSIDQVPDHWCKCKMTKSMIAKFARQTKKKKTENKRDIYFNETTMEELLNLRKPISLRRA